MYTVSADLISTQDDEQESNTKNSEVGFFPVKQVPAAYQNANYAYDPDIRIKTIPAWQGQHIIPIIEKQRVGYE